jgi:predicted Rossmann-fold nucleotide-binding protein
MRGKMINEELILIDKLNMAIDKIDDGKIEDAKDDLITLRDEKQEVVDEFEKGVRHQLQYPMGKMPVGELANDPIK